MQKHFMQGLAAAAFALFAVSRAAFAAPSDIVKLDKTVSAQAPWETQCATDACSLSRVVGAPGIDQINIGFYIDKASAKVVAVKMDVPADTEKAGGIKFSFGKAQGPDGAASITPGTSVGFPFDSCDAKTCTVVIHDGKIEIGKP